MVLSIGYGCSDEETALLLEVRSRTMLEKLFVHVKQYHDDGQVTLYQEFDTEIGVEWGDGYIVAVNGDPLFLNIDLPAAGRYAVHLVGVPVGAIEADPTSDRHVATVCHDLTSEGSIVLDDDVYLGRLTRGSDSLDIDSDNFPESLDNFCNAQANAGFPCDTSCNNPDYLAMIDCNPAEDYEVPPGCAAIGGPTEWNPFVHDACGDCHDQDCYLGDAICYDHDEDGYPENLDCNDYDALINPSIEEICGNGIDENCTRDIDACTDGDIPCDDDGDTFLAAQPDMLGCGSDCDDTNAQIHPEIPEGLGSNPDDPYDMPNCDDGIDNNCNGRIDERCENDLDSDGIEYEFDCNDCNASIGPGFPEVCGNGVDEDCDGVDLPCSPNDFDGDGYDAEPIGTDCEDDDVLTFPGAADFCGDGIAQNCALDHECRSDDDGDFFDVDDCNDEVAGTNPWAVERCDSDGLEFEGFDDDCDGQLNEVPWELNSTQGCGLQESGEGWESIIYDDDIDHCGECHHPCWPGSTFREGDHCAGGQCMCFDLGYGCDGGVTNYCCPDGCQDISVDEMHCGGCTEEYRCVPNGDEVCEATGLGGSGECHCPHEADRRRCNDPVSLNENACCPGSGCTNIDTDVNNCGACGNICTADIAPGPRGDLCAANVEGNGTCYCESIGMVCSGSDWCTGVGSGRELEGSCGCHDLTSEFSNCGSCEHECDPNETCIDSGCWCTYASANCDGSDTNFCCPNASYCVNLMDDEEHCGDCFAPRCRPGESCEGGSCICNGGGGCGANQVCCPGSGCVNALTDESNCGPDDDYESSTPAACGHRCQAGVECEDGNCSCGVGGDCPGGETCCFDTYCTDLQTDPDNCGTCDNECRVGEECVGGTCVCGADCNDGNSCTEDPCVSSRCEHHTLDNDDDGYCGGGCRDQDSGESGDCINGDCDDNNADANPGDTEDCDTSFDDDCDGSTNDLGADNCDDFYQDVDGDTYGDEDISPRCQCRSSGNYTADRALDCVDDNAAINPSRTDICNGEDDDCNTSTLDGSADCPGGAAFCCGSPRACRSCCDDDQCSGDHNHCTSYSCACQSWWTDCGGTCNCETGGAQVCCSSTCYNGTCCNDGNCSSTAAPDCNTSSHTCQCIGGMVCGTTCVHGAACCGDGDCGGGTPNCCSNQCEECCNAADCGAGDWLCTDNNCNCPGVVCGGECFAGGECCVDGDCGGGTPNCCGHTCEECCDAGDCGPGDWACSSNNCSCSGINCSGNCYGSGDCCDDGDCGGGTPSCCSNVCEECCDDEDCGSGDWTCFSNNCNCGGVDCSGTCHDPGDCCSDANCTLPDTCIGWSCGCTPESDCGTAGCDCGDCDDGCGSEFWCGSCLGSQNPDCWNNACRCDAEGATCGGSDVCCSPGGCQECCDSGDCGGDACCSFSCCSSGDVCDGSESCCTPDTCSSYECGSPPDGCDGPGLSCPGCGNVWETDCQSDFTCGCDGNGGSSCNTTQICCGSGCCGGGTPNCCSADDTCHECCDNSHCTSPDTCDTGGTWTCG